MAEYQPTSRRPIADLFRATAYPAVRLCVALRVHPDAVSYASVAAAGGAGLCFAQSAHHPLLLLLGVGFCFLRLWFNMLDGMVALASGKASLRGEILNDLPDRVSDVVIFVGMAHSGLCNPYPAYWVAIAAVLVAYVGTFGQAVGTGRQFGGVMAKPWRMVAVSAGACITYAMLTWGGSAIRWQGLTVQDWTHALILLGCVQTVMIRLSRIMAQLRVKASAATPAQPPSRQESAP